MPLFPMTRQEANFIECAVQVGAEDPDRDENLVERMLNKLDGGFPASAFEDDELVCLVDCFAIGFDVGRSGSGFDDAKLEQLKARIDGLVTKPDGLSFH